MSAEAQADITEHRAVMAALRSWFWRTPDHPALGGYADKMAEALAQATVGDALAVWLDRRDLLGAAPHAEFAPDLRRRMSQARTAATDAREEASR